MEKQAFVNKLKEVLLEGGSLNDLETNLWSKENFNNLNTVTNKSLIEGKKSFLEKIKVQILQDGNMHRALHPLMVEIMTLYYFIPTNISQRTKKNVVKELAEANLNLPALDFSFSYDSLKFDGIASGGMGYNTNKQKEIFYLIKAFSQWFEKDKDNRILLLENATKFQGFLDNVEEGRTPQCRHALLHLLFPNYYEHIISSSEKIKLVSAFGGLIKDSMTENSWDIDQQIREIKFRLQEERGKETNFYDEEIRKFWSEDTTKSIKGLDISLLEYKKQIVLYGPPGTSKTYTAKELAKDIIHHRLAKELGVSLFEASGKEKLDKALSHNIHLLQLHPAYSYEDFVRGLHFQDGNTSYRSGYLLSLIDKMKEAPELPHVLILDEINRVDLSRLFGECFSALENRGESIDLIGNAGSDPIKLSIPENLYIIGTMNLIDHSVEQLDFALRRRFLWIEATYNPEALFSICMGDWEKLNGARNIKDLSVVENEFKRLVEAANKLNDKISNEDELGKDFVLGHVFFKDSVVFLYEMLQAQPKKKVLFFSGKSWGEPIEKLWKFSLQPLLKEYLSGVDKKSQEKLLFDLKSAFKPNAG